MSANQMHRGNSYSFLRKFTKLSFSIVNSTNLPFTVLCSKIEKWRERERERERDKKIKKFKASDFYTIDAPFLYGAKLVTVFPHTTRLTNQRMKISYLLMSLIALGSNESTITTTSFYTLLQIAYRIR